MKTAGIRELKGHLSAYLREVAHGEVVLVTDRGQVVAELRPPGDAERAASPSELRWRALVARGLLRPALKDGGFDWSSLTRLRLPPGTAARLLAAEREE